MSQGEFVAPCGCLWRDDQLQAPCAGWQELVAERDRLRQDWDATLGQLRGVEERMAGHMPPWMSDEGA